jgi:hypothetical protein
LILDILGCISQMPGSCDLYCRSASWLPNA